MTKRQIWILSRQQKADKKAKTIQEEYKTEYKPSTSQKLSKFITKDEYKPIRDLFTNG